MKKRLEILIDAAIIAVSRKDYYEAMRIIERIENLKRRGVTN